MMSTLKNILTIVESSHDRSWQNALDDIQLSLNSTTHRVTKESLLELLVGKVPRPLSLMAVDDHGIEIDLEELRGRAEKLMHKDVNKAKVTSFAAGDYDSLD
ncbi:unnamed protein product [Parnassius mnemosyne]|uniref:Uncharacterized protein n=1 Tax=Parnassius mnemosyne TaxID=213953 RepID=A0AAV1LYJ7_9NEOP